MLPLTVKLWAVDQAHATLSRGAPDERVASPPSMGKDVGSPTSLEM
jgi:hypothetical protein